MNCFELPYICTYHFIYGYIFIMHTNFYSIRWTNATEPTKRKQIYAHAHKHTHIDAHVYMHVRTCIYEKTYTNNLLTPTHVSSSSYSL